MQPLLFHTYDPTYLKLIQREYVAHSSMGCQSCHIRQTELTSNKWDHKYEREEAAYPSEFLRTNKYWPPVGRVDNVYGDKNLFCTCPSMEEYEDTAA